MHLKSLAAAASLAVCGASAFLVPPEVTSSSETSAAGVLTIVPATASAQTLDLDCPGCPLVLEGRHGRFRVTNELVRSHLQLNFSVDHADGARDRLTVNGFELYPSSDPFKQALTAPHIPDFPAAASSSGRRRRHGARPLEPVLGFGLAVSPAQAVDEDAALELVQLDLQVFEVGGSFVTGLDNVRVRLVVAQGGALLMGALETTPTKTMAMPVPFAVPAGPTSVGADGKECTTMLCRLKAMVGDSVAHVKPWRHCGGKGAIDGIVKPGEEEQQEEAKLDETPQEHRNIDDELYKAQHTWTQLAKNIWSTILLPAFVGICIGILIGAVATWYVVLISSNLTPPTKLDCKS